jgi:hypothetical protein
MFWVEEWAAVSDRRRFRIWLRLILVMWHWGNQWAIFMAPLIAGHSQPM